MSHTLNELSFIKAAVNAAQITGKDAPFVTIVLEKIDKQIAKETKKQQA